MTCLIPCRIFVSILFVRKMGPWDRYLSRFWNSILDGFRFSMFSRVLSSNSRFARQYSRLSRSVSGLSRFASQSSRSYSTGAASGTHDFHDANALASPFQIGFAVAAGLGCGAALLYGNRLFAVEVGVVCDFLLPG